jgi:hypothetical protein
MDAKEFTYFLQGFFELTDSENLSPGQVKIIKHKLSSVFNKVTPSYSIPISNTKPGQVLQYKEDRVEWVDNPTCNVSSFAGVSGAYHNGSEPLSLFYGKLNAPLVKDSKACDLTAISANYESYLDSLKNNLSQTC